MKSRARHWTIPKTTGALARTTLAALAARAAMTLTAIAGIFAAVTPVTAGVMSGNCRLGNQPAATLLLPYFRTDLNNPAGETTLFAINNASAKPALARVVLWTDWGVPTLAFDIYLTGYDVQTLNVRNLLTGPLPMTGGDHSPQGQFSDAADAAWPTQ